MDYEVAIRFAYSIVIQMRFHKPFDPIMPQQPIAKQANTLNISMSHSSGHCGHKNAPDNPCQTKQLFFLVRFTCVLACFKRQGRDMIHDLYTQLGEAISSGAF